MTQVTLEEDRMKVRFKGTCLVQSQSLLVTHRG